MKKISTLFVLLMTIGLLSGCGAASIMNARSDMEQSKVNYKNCLAQHPKDINSCNGAKAAYEADMEAFKTTSNPYGQNDTVNVNVRKQ
ncbi:MAG: hypothetical protein K9G62_03850 [Alphaproteobacteria bacterium]|nr:hypothetical protein [Alphaproteobacteria bacterium]